MKSLLGARVPRSPAAIFSFQSPFKHSLPAGLLLLITFSLSHAQATKLKLGAVIPGTENVQLVYNGDFQFQGPLITNSHPFPVGWTRQADMFVGGGVNRVQTDNGVVALAHVDGSAPVCMYARTIKLQPSTAYVLSAY